MSKSDTLGDKCKHFEMMENSKKAMVGIPLLARLDGKAFHTFTRNLQRPFDKGMQRCMIETTAYLVEETHALIGYTQSDEITLLWYQDPESKAQFVFDGRFQKITSVLAGMSSARFNKLMVTHLPNKAHLTPCFDCRVWQVPSKKEAFNAFMWREDDATKNAITMAASAYYSHKELHQKNSSDKQEMLFQKGINWNDYPASFKRGQYVRRETYQRLLTEEEWLKIPEKNRPAKNELVTRSHTKEIDAPPLRRIGNYIEFLFDKQPPLPREHVDTKQNTTAVNENGATT